MGKKGGRKGKKRKEEKKEKIKRKNRAVSSLTGSPYYQACSLNC